MMSRAHCRVTRSLGPRRTTPKGRTKICSSQATGRLGKLSRISFILRSMVRKPSCMIHSTSGRSASWRPSSSQRLSTAQSM